MTREKSIRLSFNNAILIEQAKKNRLLGLILLGFLLIVILRHSVLLGSLYLNSGFVNLNHSDQVKGLKSSQNAEPQQIEYLLTKAAQYSQTSQAAKWGLALHFLATNNKEMAIATWKDGAVPVSNMLLFGMLAEDRRDWDTALTWYELAAEFDLAEAANAFGDLLYQEKKFGQAITVWQDTLGNNPSNQQRLTWWYGLINSLEASQQWENVIATSKDALSEFPDNSKLFAYLGKAQYAQQGNADSAIATVKEGITYNVADAEAYAAIGSILAQEENYSEALAWYSQAIENDPNIRSWYVSRANMARKAGDWETAKTLYIEAIALNPEYAPPYYEISWLYKLLGESEQAIKAIEMAIKFHKSPTVNYYFRAGQIYEWAGLPNKAVSAYQQAAKIAPNDRRMEDAIARIQER